MKIQISNLQTTLLVANYIMTSFLIILPQAMFDFGLHYVWMSAAIWMILTSLLILIGLGIRKGPAQYRFLIPQQGTVTIGSKIFAVIMALFLMLILIRDLRGFTDFAGLALLQQTPPQIIVFASIICLIYLAWLGLEVIARFNDIYFTVMALVMLVLPILLLNEIEPGKLMPLFSTNTLPAVFKAGFAGLSWIGEWVIILLFVSVIKPSADTVRSVIWGIGLGIFLILTILISSIMVLGAVVAKFTTYPSYLLVRQINITDFLDRLDLIIVFFWVPTLFSKMGLTLYGILQCVQIIFNERIKLFLIPAGLLSGLLSIMLFDNHITHFYYSARTWPVLGLILEVIILVLYLLLARRHSRIQNR